ncbi:hypothetical protein BT93_F1926 [Corymbia citriodora subsp. variegata]|nr:hypothetical protein BT93_F1926 [Corymbia citriodora subsp. variegata]
MIKISASFGIFSLVLVAIEIFGSISSQETIGCILETRLTPRHRTNSQPSDERRCEVIRGRSPRAISSRFTMPGWDHPLELHNAASFHSGYANCSRAKQANAAPRLIEMPKYILKNKRENVKTSIEKGGGVGREVRHPQPDKD